MGQLYLVMPNLRPNIFLEFFHLQSALVYEFLRGGVWAPTCFGHLKFKVTNLWEFFPLPSALESGIFQRGCQGSKCFLVMLNLR